MSWYSVEISVHGLSVGTDADDVFGRSIDSEASEKANLQVSGRQNSSQHQRACALADGKQAENATVRAEHNKKETYVQVIRSRDLGIGLLQFELLVVRSSTVTRQRSSNRTAPEPVTFAPSPMTAQLELESSSSVVS